MPKTSRVQYCKMSHGKQRKYDTFVKATEPKSSKKCDGGNEEVLTTSTEHECASGNISEKSNAEIDDDSTTFASSSDSCHSHFAATEIIDCPVADLA